MATRGRTPELRWFEWYKAPETEHQSMVAVRSYDAALAYVPNHLRTPEVCLAAVSRNGRSLVHVPLQHRTRRLCLTAVRHGACLLDVPLGIRAKAEVLVEAARLGIAGMNQILDAGCRLTSRHYRAFVRSGCPLFMIPENERTSDICRAAVRRSPSELRHVPPRERTRELCMDAVRANGSLLEHVPEGIVDLQMSCMAIRNYPWALRHTPKRFRTRELCMEAVVACKSSLAFVPMHMRTEAICRAAVCDSPSSLRYVPEDLRTDELYRLALESDDDDAGYFVPVLLLCQCRHRQHRPGIFRYLPPEAKTEELCLRAVRHEPSMLTHVPPAQKTPEVCLAAVARDGQLLRFVPLDLRSDELCLAAVASCGRSLAFTPMSFRTYGVCLEATRHGAYVAHVPEQHLDQRMCLAAVSYGSLQSIPMPMRTYAVCAAAVAVNGTNLLYVPDEMHDAHLCALALTSVRTRKDEVLRRVPDGVGGLLHGCVVCHRACTWRDSERLRFILELVFCATLSFSALSNVAASLVSCTSKDLPSAGGERRTV